MLQKAVRRAAVLLAVLLLAGCAAPPSDTGGRDSGAVSPSGTQNAAGGDPSAEDEKTPDDFCAGDASAQTPEEAPAAQPPQSEEENAMSAPISITLTVDGTAFAATLYDNETARALAEQLPLTLDMSELNGNEKYFYLPFSLPTDSFAPGDIHAGDLMLYGDSCLVVFYDSFSTGYRYTALGAVTDGEGLAAALGAGAVQVTFSLQ